MTISQWEQAQRDIQALSSTAENTDSLDWFLEVDKYYTRYLPVRRNKLKALVNNNATKFFNVMSKKYMAYLNTTNATAAALFKKQLEKWDKQALEDRFSALTE